MKNRIKEIRIMKGISIDKLADVSGLNRSTIMKAEQETIETTRVGIGTFNAIANALEVSLMELIDAEPKRKGKNVKKFSNKKLDKIKMLRKSIYESDNERSGKRTRDQ